MTAFTDLIIWMDGGAILGEDVTLAVSGDFIAAERQITQGDNLQEGTLAHVDNLQVIHFDTKTKKKTDITGLIPNDQMELVGDAVMEQHFHVEAR